MNYLGHPGGVHPHATNSACIQVFINSFPKSAEFISAYVDTKLRKSVSSASDALGEASLDDILQIFRYIPRPTTPAA